MPCYTPLKGYCKLGGGWCFDFSKSNGNYMEVACGQCLGCRLDHARMWAIRISHEAAMYEFDNGNCFITLTYDPKFLPDNWSLVKRDFQLFMKRLRKWASRDAGNGIRFFMCGEYGMMCRHSLATMENEDGIPLCQDGYGCRLGRPHFHAILFNISFPDMVVCGRGKGDILYYTDSNLVSLWSMGFVTIGSVTMESAGYVARYAIKKITGKAAKDHYLTMDDEGIFSPVEPEFCTMSNGGGIKGAGGIGATWFEKFSTDVFPADDVPVPGQGVYKKVPGYYNILMERDDPKIIEEVKSERMKYMLSHKEEFTPERLLSKYKVKKVQVSSLKRKI